MRKSDEVWRPECLVQRGGSCVSVMFGGCVGVGTLEPVMENIDSEKCIECLDQNVWPVIAKKFPEGQCPNTHLKKNIPEKKKRNNVNCMSRPSQSPDINIIENVWRTIKLKLENKKHLIKTQQDLINHVKGIWYSLPVHNIQSLYVSIPSRIRQVIISKGHITKY
jgi:hypothetical protein